MNELRQILSASYKSCWISWIGWIRAIIPFSIKNWYISQSHCKGKIGRSVWNYALGASWLTFPVFTVLKPIFVTPNNHHTILYDLLGLSQNLQYSIIIELTGNETKATRIFLFLSDPLKKGVKMASRPTITYRPLHQIIVVIFCRSHFHPVAQTANQEL